MFCRRVIILFYAVRFGAAICTAADKENNELAELRQAAQAESGDSLQKAGAVDNKENFTAGSLGLQALNPEISIVGDMLWKSQNGGSGDVSSDFIFRTLGIHMQAYLDPYTRFKAAVEINEHDTELGEAYMTRFGMLPHVNLTLGKFRQQFGVVNRWHKHGLDQIDFPLALRNIFGEGGLNQVGVSLEWSMPDFSGISQALIVQVTDGQNERLFDGNTDNSPSELAHYKLYHDLTPSTYAECGLSVLHGQNQEWLVDEEVVNDSLDTFVYGADFTVLWEPTDAMRYRNLTWRSELYAVSRDILAPDGSGPDTIDAWGAYSYLESKVTRTVIMGVRLDYFVPDTKSYAVEDDSGLTPLAVTEDGADRWQVSPYITWNQSPFVHFRVEYDYQDGSGTGPDEQTVWLQCIFAAGPHKHERY